MFGIFSKTKNGLNGIKNQIKTEILDNLFNLGDISITKPNSQVQSVVLKNNRLYAFTPITAEELKDIIENEAEWRAMQTKEAAGLYLGANMVNSKIKLVTETGF
jgi:hypothetical protein